MARKKNELSDVDKFFIDSNRDRMDTVELARATNTRQEDVESYKRSQEHRVNYEKIQEEKGKKKRRRGLTVMDGGDSARMDKIVENHKKDVYNRDGVEKIYDKRPNV